MVFIAIYYMFMDQFAVQHIADRPGEYTGYVHDWVAVTNAPLHCLC